MVTKPISFFSDSIAIMPHSATSEEHLSRPVSIAEFAAGEPVRLEEILDGNSKGEYIVSAGKGGTEHFRFMQGPES